MIVKKADFSFTDVKPVNLSDLNELDGVLIRTAANRIIIEPGSEKSSIIEAEIKKHPNALFFRAKAIEANKPNTNGDYFSTEELLKSYKSFESVPFFTNHNNQNIENARGKVIFAEWLDAEDACYVLAFVDRDAYPDICRGIEQEYVTGVSMGCSVEYSICNICGNKAEKTDDYCTHIRNRKGRKFSGRARNVTTGQTKEFKNEPVFEYNFGLKFIELSAVVDPACPSCHIQGIIANDDYMAKVASLENSLFMVREAAIEKKASQEEIQQIDGVLQTLEGIAVNLIKNRKQVEMEFASELVDILSQLQTWMDELVGAGYGNLPSAEVPGTVGDQPEMAPEVPGVPGAEAALPTPPPVDQAGVAPMAASTTGVPTTGAGGVQQPTLPITTPIRPRADVTDSRTIQRVADFGCTPKYIPNVETRSNTGSEIMRKASELVGKLNKSGDVEMGKRRTITAKQQEKEKVMEILSNSWEEKQDFFEYIKQMPSIQDNEHRLLINKRDESFIVVGENKSDPEDRVVWTYEDLTDDDKKMIQASPKDASVRFLELFSEKSKKQKEGENIMTDISKNAGATTVNPVPQEVQEAQLRQKGLYHSRTDTEQNQVTQAQLEAKRKGEKDYLTEKQLDDSELKLNPRANEEPEEVQEAQLKPLREDDEKNTITQAQLDDQRKDDEPEQVTERQLDKTPAPWARTADRDPSLFKSANDHMKSVINVLAETVMAAGCAPDEACKVASSLVDSTKNRVYLASSILETSEDKDEIDFGKRIAFWNNKNLKVASTGKKEIAQLIVDGLRKVASDTTINPDVLIQAVDVIGDGKDGTESVDRAVNEKIAEAASQEETQVNVKDELRAALKADVPESTEERETERDSILSAALDQDVKMQREAERQAWEKVINKEAAKNADHIIETSFTESGLKKDDSSFKSGIVSFARGALASQSLKLAAVTNVTISGDTIQIAVQTDEGEEEVEIPIGDVSAPLPEETVPEGDLTGEGLEDTLGGPEVAPAAPAAAPAAAPVGGMTPFANATDKMTREAQAPMGGGMPGMDGGQAGGAPEQGLPGPLPEGDAIQSLTQGDIGEEGVEDVPTIGEQQMPWTICPECGSSDVDVSNEEGDIHGKCNNCSAEYEALIKKEVEFKITKPTVSVGKPAGEEGGEDILGMPEAPAETPEVPSLPVAAQTRIDKGTIVRIAENREKHGHVCPACGHTKCEASKDGDGHSEFACPACKTDIVKDIMISSSDPSQSFLRVRWDVRPNTECEGCSDEVAKFASKVKVAQMIKTAAANKDSFPWSNCVERMARQYGGNTVASFGPCKGKLLADCVCKDLQRLGFSKIKDMVRLADASTQKDPLDECVEDQKKKGHDIKEATNICACLKKKFASELSDNIYAHAFGKDVIDGKELRVTAQDLTTLHELSKEEAEAVVEAEKAEAEKQLDEDIGADLPPLEEAEVEVEVVSETSTPEIEASGKAYILLEAEVTEATEATETTETVEASSDADEVIKDSVDEESERKQAMAMNGQRVRSVNEEVFNMASLKTASTPKKVKDIEGNVAAGVPRSQAYMGEEAKADSMINQTLKAPVVPRSDAYMGHEKEADSMINAKLKLPDVAVDSSYMGQEKAVQSGYDSAVGGKGMPAINNEIKGTVIANDTKTTKEAKQMKQVDTVEGDVDAGVPRSDAKMGEEAKADSMINDPNKGPDVPRSDAYMGHEKEADSLINDPLKGPDVPIDNAYMGHEKETQQGYDNVNGGKGMPAINDKMLKQVKMQREEQLSKISQAREKQAMKVASWLVGNGRITNDLEAFDAAVKALSAFEIDKIVTVASMLFPEKQVKTSASVATQEARTASAESHGIPAIVMESKNKSSEDNRDDFVKKLAGAFTVGNRDFDHKLTLYGEKE